MSDALRVCMVTTSYPRWEGDLAGHFVASLARALADEGHHVTVVAPHAAGALAEETSDSVRVVRFRYLPAALERVAYGSGLVSNLKHDLLALLGLPAFVIAMRQALRREARGCDVVHAHWAPTAVASRAWAMGSPMVLTLHGSDTSLARAGQPWAGLLSRAVSHAKAIDVVSSEQRAQLEEGTRVCECPVEVIPSGIPSELTIRPRPATAETFTFVFAGRLIAGKGVDELVSAFAQCPANTRLVVLGDGPRSASMRASAIREGILDRIDFRGEVPHDVAITEIAAADALVLPSHAEGSPLSVLEALALGTPVVATSVGAIPDLLGEAGILVEPGSIDSLSHAMRLVVKERDSYSNAASAGRKRISQEYGWPSIARRTAELYRRALDA